MLVSRYGTLSPTSKVFVHRALSPRTLFAETQNGDLVHIDHTKTGTQHLICPDCKRRIFARHYQSGKRVDHFYHASESEGGAYPGGECTSSGETALHLLAKEIISDAKDLTVPEVLVHHRGETRRACSAMSIAILSVEIEHSLGSIRPDAIVHHQTDEASEKSLAVEIHVTHAVDDHKIEVFKNLSLDALEIDLSRIDRSLDLQELTDLVLYTAPRQWLINGLTKRVRSEMEADWRQAEEVREEARAAALVKEQARKAAAEKLAQERKSRIQKLLSAWSRPIPKASQEDLQESAILIRDLTAIGLGETVPKPQLFDAAFSVDHRIWKSRIIREFTHNRQNRFTIYDVLNHVCKLGYTKPELSENIRDIGRECWALNNGFRSVFSALREFLSHLISVGLLQEIESGNSKYYESRGEIERTISVIFGDDSGYISLARVLGKRGYHIAIGGAVLQSPSDLLPFLAEVRKRKDQEQLLAIIQKLGRAFQLSNSEISWRLPENYAGIYLIDKGNGSRASFSNIIQSVRRDMQKIEMQKLRTAARESIEKSLLEHPSASNLIFALLNRHPAKFEAIEALEEILEAELLQREDIAMLWNATNKFVNKISASLRFLSEYNTQFCDHIQRDVVKHVFQACPQYMTSETDFKIFLHAEACELQGKEEPIRRQVKLVADRLKQYGKYEFLTKSLASKLPTDSMPLGCKMLGEESRNLRNAILGNSS